jgi:glycosyltransferase involved in cell wall biosynthesis
MNSLVSIIISTYNSSPFIVETLESIANQSWKEIELIITDDCSEDDTVRISQEWLKENIHRFVNTVLLQSEKNTGIAANANRGLYSAKGDWIKFLGADDTLKTGCIEDNMSRVASDPEIKVLFSRIEVYRETFEQKNLIETIPDNQFYPDGIMAPARSAESQYKMLLLCDRIHFSPSVFLHRETLLSVGGLDERFRLLEDYPLWLNLTKNGHKLHFMEKITVNYRQHSKAINNTGIHFLINPNYFRLEDFRRIYTYPYLPAAIRLNQRFTWYASQVFRCNWLNRNNMFNRSLHSLLTSYLNPFKYYIFLKKRSCRSQKNNEFYM